MQSDPSQLGLAKFNPGSFIIVEGKEDEPVFYIIRSGQVSLQKEARIVAEEGGNLLNPGDFFGVISAMSGHPRIETAVALTEVIVIVVRKDQFGVLIQKNTPIALKIIRSFSRKLRFFDSALTKLSFKAAVDEDPTNLYPLGMYYLKKKNYKLAAYAFLRYLQFNSTGNYAPNAKEQLRDLSAMIEIKMPEKTTGFSRTFEDNDVVFLEHELGEELYIIQQGRVKITKIVDNNEIMLAVLQPGDIFGEMAILDNKPRSASAISFGESVMLVVNKDNFETMVSNQPQLATKLITLLSERIWTSYKQFANLLIDDPLGRIYDTLLTQVQKSRIPIRKNGKHTFEFGANELITMVGIAADKGKLVIRELFENPKVLLDKGKITVTDLDDLQKQADFYRKKSLIARKIEDGKLKK